MPRIAGYSDWSKPEIIVYCNARQEVVWRQCLPRIASHLGRLIKQVFLNIRPCQPAQARWTGVPAVAIFCFGLWCFHGLLSLLLSARAFPREADAPNQPAGGNAADADVQNSELRIQNQIKSKSNQIKSSRFRTVRIQVTVTVTVKLVIVTVTVTVSL